MMSQKLKKSGKLITTMCAIAIALLFVSTVTAVPQVQSKSLMDKINEKEQFQTIISQLNDGDIGTQDLTSFLQALIELLINFIKDNILGENGQLPSLDNGLLNIIISILKTLFTIPIMMIQFLLSTSVGIINGLIKLIKAIISIILLIFGGIQTVLTLAGILMLFIGIMSKIGIKALAVMGAPIFALLTAQIIISSGELIGGLSVAIFSILALLIFLAIPLAIVLGLLYFLTPENIQLGERININFNPKGTGLIYMLLSILSNRLSS